MACKESICRNCFHSYVCEQFNENKDDNNEKCHFANDHYIPRADVVPKSEVEKNEAEVERLRKIFDSYALQYGTVMDKYIVIKRVREDVAREIFEEIEKYKRIIIEGVKPVYTLKQRELEELKKKYTEGEK